ncbi:MAG: hypothetical protein VYE42_00130, partial [Actinomycetota bacterium]|nr:hypothetical protein [Actinomycetota bacterium]
SYVCGSEDYQFAGIFFGVAVGLAVGTVGWLVTSAFHRPPFSVPALERLIGQILVIAAVTIVVVLIPVYTRAPAFLSCRHGWSSTAAFLQPADWRVAVALVGGLLVGGGSACGLVVAGTPTFDRVAAGMSWRNIRSVALVYVVVAAVLVGLNVGFIFLEESPHASGSAKHAAVVFFALLHELVDHIMVPLIVSAMALTTGTHTRPTPVFVAAVVIEVTNSVVAPVIAQLIASEGCFRDQLFSSPTAVSASVTVAFCNNGTYTTESECGFWSWSWFSYPVGVSYTPPFQFDGSRCLSSIITLYTPEYLVIFAIRMLFYPFAWWLARRGTPWVVAGLQPPVLLASAFVNGRNRLLCKPSAATDGVVRADGVVEILHSIEPATHCFNLLVIAVCPGMFAPVIAVAALVTLGCRHVVFWA